MFKAERFFRVLLLAYPREFRREYEREMLTVFRDCYRDDKEHGKLWARVLLDLIRSASIEHLEKWGKENSFMENLRRDAIAVIGCLAIIIGAAALLEYGRSHEVWSIMFFGYALDALVVTGVIGNLFVFVLVKATRFHPLRIALWTFVIVHAALVTFALILDSFVSPHTATGAILIGYVLSFLFWLGVHWIWDLRQNKQQLAT